MHSFVLNVVRQVPDALPHSASVIYLATCDHTDSGSSIEVLDC